MTVTVTIDEAQAQLSLLILLALSGGEVVITKDDLPLVKLIPLSQEEKFRLAPGVDRGQIRINPDFKRVSGNVCKRDNV